MKTEERIKSDAAKAISKIVAQKMQSGEMTPEMDAYNSVISDMLLNAFLEGVDCGTKIFEEKLNVLSNKMKGK